MVGGLQVLDIEMGVDLGGFEAGVAEHFLDDPDVSTVAVHVGRAGVAQEVAGSRFGDAGGLHLLGNPSSDVGRGDAGGVSREDESRFAGDACHERAGLGQIAVEVLGSALTDGEKA